MAAGRTTAAIRARHAPSTFSRMPPTGSTVPASVSSPVIATPLRTGCPVSAETSAAASHPRRRAVESSSLAAPARRSACERTHVTATLADSLIIGPAVPVTCSVSRPGRHAFHALVSLVMTDKPYGVGRPEARPDAESLVRWTGALRVVRTRRAPVAAGTTG